MSIGVVTVVDTGVSIGVVTRVDTGVSIGMAEGWTQA